MPRWSSSNTTALRLHEPLHLLEVYSVPVLGITTRHDVRSSGYCQQEEGFMQCSHDICTCTETHQAGFCSTECRDADQGPVCPCSHDDCTANAANLEVPLT
jgi:hypothetical protein